jgi:hypothetical protein
MPTVARRPTPRLPAPPRGAPCAPAPAWLATRQPPPPTLAAAAGRLADLAARLEARGDHRAAFAATYAMQVHDMAIEVSEPGRYRDPAWMTRLALDFAQRYLDAFAAHEAGDRAAVPAGWRLALDRARAGDGPLMGDVLLAMNVHITHDLAVSAAAVGPTPDHRADFMRFNETMRRNVERVQALLEARFLRPGGSLVGALDAALGPVDEWVAGQAISRLRERAWDDAVRLRQEGPAAQARLDERAAKVGRVLDWLGQRLPAAWIRERRL